MILYNLFNLAIKIINLTMFFYIDLKHLINLLIEHFINSLKFLINHANKKFIKFLSMSKSRKL